MGTRSMIGVWNPETNEVTATYCHYDGYLEGVGHTLVHAYNTPARAVSVASTGYLSALTKNLSLSLADSVHTKEPTIYDSIETYLTCGFRDTGAEYIYLFDGSIWFYAHPDLTGGQFEEVEMNLRAAA